MRTIPVLVSRLAKAALLVTAAVAAAPPLLAQAVYVPVPSTVGTGASLALRVPVANRGAVPRRFAAVFLPSGTDGTVRPPAPPKITVAGGGTIVLGPSQLAPGSGLLEVSGAPQLAVGAEITLAAGGATTGISPPVLTAKSLIAANGAALLTSLRRNAAETTNLAVVNLSRQPASCTLKLQRSTGAAIVPDATIAMPPLAQRTFDDAFGTAGAPTLADARIEVSCNQGFYAYATVVSGSPLALRFVAPSASIADGLPAPGDNPPPSGDPVLVERPGVFFSPVQGASALDVLLPLVPGRAYSKATVEFDLTSGPQFAPVFDSIVGLVRPPSGSAAGTLYYGLHIRGRRNRTFIDLGVPVLEPALKGNYGWRTNATYRIKITYDTTARNMLLQVFQGGQVVHNLGGGTFNHDLSENGGGMRLKFGLPAIADQAYFPPIGWIFANLVARVE